MAKNAIKEGIKPKKITKNDKKKLPKMTMKH